MHALSAFRALLGWSCSCTHQALRPCSLISRRAFCLCRFKYIIIRLSDPVATDGGRSKLLVRGDRHSGYHNDVLQRAKREVRMTPGCAGLALEPLGGGRIEHLPGEGSVLVYGYSMAFGPAVHEVAVEIVRRAFPWYEADRVRAEYAGY